MWLQELSEVLKMDKTALNMQIKLYTSNCILPYINNI